MMKTFTMVSFLAVASAFLSTLAASEERVLAASVPDGPRAIC